MASERELERKPELHFLMVANGIIQRVGSQALYSDQVDDLGKELFGRRWGGVTNQTDWRPERGRYYVVNTATSRRSAGVHWVAIFVTAAGVPYAYDSFGRNPRRLLHRVGKPAIRAGHSLRGTDPDAEQLDGTEICGQYSLAWLVVCRDMGVKMAALV